MRDATPEFAQIPGKLAKVVPFAAVKASGGSVFAKMKP